ncbi:MAG: hypothetical protein K2G70_02525 [Turicibacter sp.]|nr:hypothetical protein [Turicibacter sp.]
MNLFQPLLIDSFQAFETIDSRYFRSDHQQETLMNRTKRFYHLLAPTEASIKEILLVSTYLHF